MSEQRIIEQRPQAASGMTWPEALKHLQDGQLLTLNSEGDIQVELGVYSIHKGTLYRTYQYAALSHYRNTGTIAGACLTLHDLTATTWRIYDPAKEFKE